MSSVGNTTAGRIPIRRRRGSPSGRSQAGAKPSVLSKASALGLGVLAAVGGFVDFGGIVTSTQAGAQFKFALVWTIVIGVVGYSVFAEMSARVAISNSQATFDIIRERFGARLAMIPLISSTIAQVLTVFVELAGMSVVLQYISGGSYLFFVPVVGILLIAVIWFTGYELMDTAASLVGLTMLISLVIMIKVVHDWAGLGLSLVHPSMTTAHPLVAYLFMVVSLLGAYMTPYQFAFYSSGALEEEWTGKDMLTNRVVSIIGTLFGGVITLGITAYAASTLYPSSGNLTSLPQILSPAARTFGEIGVVVFLIGTFAVCAGGGLESAMSGSYELAQYFGMNWGKRGKPGTAPVFHFGVMVVTALAVVIAETQINPIKMTTVAMAIAAIALPSNFLAIVLVAGDRRWMGKQKNNLYISLIAWFLVALLTVVAIAAIPFAFLSGNL